MNEQRTLVLTLTKIPFELMYKGIKDKEFRKPSDWIKSRLFNKDGTRKDYDVIKFTNGYGNDKPTFTAIFNGFDSIKEDASISYDTLTVEVSKGDFVIFLGDVIKKQNINKTIK